MTRTMTQLEPKKKKKEKKKWQHISWPYINWEAHKHPYVHHARAEVDRKEIHIRACFSHPISNIHNYEIRGKLHYKDLHKHILAACGSFCMFFFSFSSSFLIPPPHTIGFHSSILSSPHAPTLSTLSKLWFIIASSHPVHILSFSANKDIDLFPVPHPSPCSFYAILDKGTRPRAAIGKFNYPSVT